jgi:glucokinase
MHAQVTVSELLLAPPGTAPGERVFHREYRNLDYAEQQFGDMVAAFMGEATAAGVGDGAPQSMCFSVAGPVGPDNTCQMTNLHWTVSGEELAARFGVAGVRCWS